MALSLGTSPPLTEVSRALRARNAERVSKMSPGASGPGTPKSLKKVSGTVREVSGESPESVWRVFLECSRSFWRLFAVLGRETFSRLFLHFGPGGPERPLKGAGWFPTLSPSLEKATRIQKKQGFIRSPPNRYGPSFPFLGDAARRKL